MTTKKSTPSSPKGGASPPKGTPPQTVDPTAVPAAGGSTETPAQELTLGDLLGISSVPTADPTLPDSMAMGDDPMRLPPGFKPLPSAGPGAADYSFSAADMPPPGTAPVVDAPTPQAPRPGAPITPADADISRPSGAGVRWESRIQVLEAWRYPGNFREAPDWVDRNWLAWGDWDPIRQIEAGPALRVPMAYGDGANVIARIGDYLVQQEIRSIDRAPFVKIEVWAGPEFEKNFMPVMSSPPPRRVPDFDDARAA